MKKRLIAAMVLVLSGLALIDVGAAAKVDFNGTWKIDLKKSDTDKEPIAQGCLMV